jgi:hypothetical protein
MPACFTSRHGRFRWNSGGGESADARWSWILLRIAGDNIFEEKSLESWTLLISILLTQLLRSPKFTMATTSFDDMSYSQDLSSQDFPGAARRGPRPLLFGSGSTGNGTGLNAGCLPFNPGPEFKIPPQRLEVEPFLWRLHDQRSDGHTGKEWAKSRDANNKMHSYHTDAFARKDRGEVAKALRRHLRWEGGHLEEDNFCSWTTSPLYALQYAPYRKARFHDLEYEDMKLCVVNTRKLPKGAFIRDLTLMEAFSQHEPYHRPKRNLASLHNLRRGPHYFGEYLSQGALKIEGCCAMVSIEEIVACGLFDLRSEFRQAFQNPKDEWADAVVELRRMFCLLKTERSLLATDRELNAAWSIGMRYGPTWRLDTALAFLALKPRHDKDVNIIRKFGPWCDRGKYFC